MQLVHITANVVSLSPAQARCLSVTTGRSLVFSGYSTI